MKFCIFKNILAFASKCYYFEWRFNTLKKDLIFPLNKKKLKIVQKRTETVEIMHLFYCNYLIFYLATSAPQEKVLCAAGCSSLV